MLDEIALDELLMNHSPGHRKSAWSWDDEESDIAVRVCLCCGQAGHYQQQLEVHIAEYGLNGMGVCVGDDGRLWDGHHRVIAAKHLNFAVIPLESRKEADARWLRDHGERSWEERLFGDTVAQQGVN